ncbi:cyclic AMP-dependent transcription factor ATF-3 isoform X1 [Danio rerio]|uniref:Cyclic AMP-dependent transcription factor ATF-3 isoform X1 n=1 Tax=Danio rerio TaxID=7955 RepID=A0AC58I270_DANRE
MMLQHPGLGPSEISASALVPCLSPPGSLTLDDFTNFTPLVKEELRYAIQNKRMSNGMSTLTTDRACMNTERPTELPGMKREVVWLSQIVRCCYFRLSQRRTTEGKEEGKETKLQQQNVGTRKRRKPIIYKRSLRSLSPSMQS